MAQKRNKKGMNNVNIFSQGVLVLMQVSCPQFTSKFPPEQLGDDIPKNIVRAVYDLLDDKASIDALNSLRSRAKRYLYQNSLPFPYDGFVFIPKIRIEEVDEGLKQLQKEWEEVVEDFIPKLPKLEAEFAKKYPELYNQDKYPSKYVLKRKFKFRWSYRTFEAPDSKLKLLTPEIYKEEMKRFKEDVQEMKDLTVSLVGNAMMTKIDSLRKQCSNDSVRKGTVDSVHTFLEKFDEIWDGYVGHDELRKMIKEVKDYMDGTNAQMLQVDDKFRGMVESKMDDVVKGLEAVPGVTRKRSIDL